MQSIKRYFFFALLIALAALPGAAKAGTTIIINGAMDEDYYGNTVTVSNTATSDGSHGIFGKETDEDPSDSFTGNTLNLNSNTSINAVRNFETIKFGDIGTANIGTLGTTPTGADPATLVKLNTDANDVTLSGVISGTGGIEKQGSGTLTLSGNNTYIGSTTISAGTLIVTGLLGIGSVAYGGAITNNGTLILNQTAYQRLSKGISGTGSLIKDGTGTLELVAENTFTGALVINSGTVGLGVLTSLAATSLSLGADAVFDFSSTTVNYFPAALKNVTVNGIGASIAPTTGGADFTGGKLSFNLDTAYAGNTLLYVNGNATIADTTTVNLAPTTGRTNLNLGEQVILMDVLGTLTGNDDYDEATLQTSGGDTYTVRINELDDTQLIAILEALSPASPLYARLKAYAESRAAGLAFVNQGMDFILNRGFASAMAATAGTGRRVNAFGGASGGWSRYRSGSRADVAGVSAIAGLAIGNDTANGRATAAAFFETGWGDYDTHNAFAGLASVAGKGNTRYTGGGVLLRHDVTGGALAGLSVEASARIGQTKTDFRTEDINYSGWNAAFDSDSLYYSLHAGASYAKPLTDKATLDLSAKLLWTRQESDEVTVYTDAVHFEQADSLRSRLGARFAYAVSDCLTPYAGASWEHEFDGEFRSTVNGNRIAPPSLQGDTAMGELGLTYRREAFTVDAAVQAYLGKRQGVSGSLHLGWAF